MTIRSMTGFGAADATAHGWLMSAQCRSVNHRGLDVRVWAPRDWPWVEAFALETARATLNRGRVEVRVEVEPVGGVAAGSVVDEATFVAVARELNAAAAAANLAAPSFADVLSFEEVRSTQAAQSIPDDIEAFQGAIRDAIANLATARVEEGARLRATMEALVDEVERCVAAISQAAGQVADEYRTKLEHRVRDALARFEIHEIDERAMLQEVAIYADRSDVSEELQRTTSHIQKLREVFDSPPDAAVGKQIDFYLQELFREANTTGAKSGSLAITDHVIAMKTAIEQMREQAANIE